MKAKILGILAGVGALVSPLVSKAEANYVEIPATFLTDLKATIGEIFSDLSLPLVLVITLPIAFWFIAKVVSVIRGGLTARGRRA